MADWIERHKSYERIQRAGTVGSVVFMLLAWYSRRKGIAGAVARYQRPHFYAAFALFLVSSAAYCAEANRFKERLFLAYTSSEKQSDEQTIEAAFVVVGAKGATARVVLRQRTSCPFLNAGEERRPMTVRAMPDVGEQASFPVLVCEAPMDSTKKRWSVEGRVLPVLKDNITTVVTLGDTGCRIKFQDAMNRTPSGSASSSNVEVTGCNAEADWPFATVSTLAAAKRPDLVIHLGDYIYREAACPPNAGKDCKGSPHGDTWATWKADFFDPAAPLLKAAPWVVVRGNHETCGKRAGEGYFRLLEPSLAKDSAPICRDMVPIYTVKLGTLLLAVLDSSGASDDSDREADVARFARQTINFKDKRAPQVIVGTGGANLAREIEDWSGARDLIAESLDAVEPRPPFNTWGFAVFTESSPGRHWTLEFVDWEGTTRFSCSLSKGQIACP